MVVASHQLIPVAEHRPAALQMQRHPGAIETDGIQVVPSRLHHPSGQIAELRPLLQLPDAVELTCSSVC